MTEFSYPWRGKKIGDAGPYSDEQWQELYKLFLRDATTLNGSYLPGSESLGAAPLQVVEIVGSLEVKTNGGSAVVQGVYYSTTGEGYTISANNNVSGYDRIDRVILRLDNSAQTVRGAVLEGTPAASPSPPSLTRNSTIHEVSLAQVLVQNGASEITASDITDERTSCRFFQPESGGTGIGTDDILPGVFLIGASGNIWDTLQLASSPVSRIVSSSSGNGAVSVPVAPDVAYASGDNSASGAYSAVTLSGLDNGNFASLSGDGVQIPAGVYNVKLWAFIFERDHSEGTKYGARIQDITNGVTVIETTCGDNTLQPFSAALQTEYIEFSPGGTVTLELQVFADNGDGRLNGTRCAWIAIQQLG